ncbi:hypothetical protein C7H19_17565 [Aphanothece hegewaldii CCALA 016]|uniref:DUF4253 domain-containing protein n=1 Tax=Aphanothece hegewaldii CCALA 016 TaxID=2107694 RepID=A0A2T1LUT8_9CHRO|nr:ankyrin repeat domain-containing protein [Aphanothece hegewaldii]PSF35189.1 hypothetical protein C7H19_17565 [Aphanothece hegewaldii CCALA 016]
MDEQLITAIEQKNLALVEELLAAGANPNATKGTKTAYQLVPHGGDQIKCALIEAGAEDPELKTSLVWVLITGRTKAVQTLIDKGADINVKTYSGTPIHAAARIGHLEIVEMLITAGADVDAGNLSGTPLMSAIEQGYTEIALKLIAAGAYPNYNSTIGGTPPIAIAAAQGFPDVIQALISSGAEINTKVRHITLNQLVIQQEASSALGTAFEAMEALGRMMESLEGVENDQEINSDRMAQIQSEIAQIKAASTQQKTHSTKPENAIDTNPVIIAARCGHTAALTTLLEAGADPHQKDGEGLSAYDWAIRNEYPNILDVLRRFGVNGKIISADEKLLLAAENGDLAVVQDCLNTGANPNARDIRRQTLDRTPLILACSAGYLRIVELLLKAGADFHLTDLGADAKPVSKTLLEHTDPETILSMNYRFGRTPLMYAAAGGHSEIVQTLLQLGADANDQDTIAYTPLALASENNHLAVVRLLVSAGADVNQAVAYGNTPLILACTAGAVEIAEMLLTHGASITQTNRDGETVLMKAAKVSSLPLVRLLIEHGADVNAVSKERKTAIAEAAGASHYVQVEPNAPNSKFTHREYRGDGKCWEWQPLNEDHIIEVVQVLLQAGADPNLPNCETTPLIEAARNNQLHLLQTLLNAGARLEVRSSDGDTAVVLAKLYNHLHILEFLQEYTGTDLSEFENTKTEDDEETEENRWGEEIEQPDFSVAAQNPNYLQAVNDLANLCGSKPISNEYWLGCFSIHVDSKRRQHINTEELQRQFLERGCFVYEPDSYYGNGPENLCIVPTTDKYEVIALHQTNGCNYGIGPGYVIQWLKDLEAKQSFILTCIAHDTLGGRFLNPIQEPEGLANLMYDFCPDIVDQGCGSVEILAENLDNSDRLYFWWD